MHAVDRPAHLRCHGLRRRRPAGSSSCSTCIQRACASPSRSASRPALTHFVALQWSICAFTIIMMVGYIAWTVIHEDGIALTAYPVMIWQAHKQFPHNLISRDGSYIAVWDQVRGRNRRSGEVRADLSRVGRGCRTCRSVQERLLSKYTGHKCAPVVLQSSQNGSMFFTASIKEAICLICHSDLISFPQKWKSSP